MDVDPAEFDDPMHCPRMNPPKWSFDLDYEREQLELLVKVTESLDRSVLAMTQQLREITNVLGAQERHLFLIKSQLLRKEEHNHSLDIAIEKQQIRQLEAQVQAMRKAVTDMEASNAVFQQHVNPQKKILKDLDTSLLVYKKFPNHKY